MILNDGGHIRSGISQRKSVLARLLGFIHRILRDMPKPFLSEMISLVCIVKKAHPLKVNLESLSAQCNSSFATDCIVPSLLADQTNVTLDISLMERAL